MSGDKGNRSENSPDRERIDGKQVSAAAVMVGFDGSITSQHALAYAAGMSHRVPGTLLVAYIAPHPPSIGLAALGSEVMSPVDLDDGAWVRALAADVLQRRPAASWEFIRCFGEVCPSLERLAQEYRTDVLVVGRSRVPRRHLLASVPARLARHARCPITVVP